MMHRCDGCEREHPLADLAPIEDLEDRGWTPGWPSPSGQCPTCGALCFPSRPVYLDSGVEALLEEAEGALAACGPPAAELRGRITAFLQQYREDRRVSLAWRTPELAP
jgi:hypothetical protein